MTVWMLIALMALVTYASRALYLFVPEVWVPRWLRENLDLVPVAILAAMIAPGALGQGPGWSDLSGPGATAITVVLYFVTKSPGWAVTGGVMSQVIWKALLRS